MRTPWSCRYAHTLLLAPDHASLFSPLQYFDDSGTWRLLGRGSVTGAHAALMAKSGDLHPLTPMLGTTEPVPHSTWIPTALFLPLDAVAMMAFTQGYGPLSLADIKLLCADNRLLLTNLKWRGGSAK